MKTIEEVLEFLEEEKDILKTKIGEFLVNDWNYSKLQIKLDHTNYLIKKIKEDNSNYDEEENYES